MMVYIISTRRIKLYIYDSKLKSPQDFQINDFLGEKYIIKYMAYYLLKINVGAGINNFHN